MAYFLYGPSNKDEYFMKKIKEHWENQYGEGTKFDLDWGKLIIIWLCVYIAIQVS